METFTLPLTVTPNPTPAELKTYIQQRYAPTHKSLKTGDHRAHIDIQTSALRSQREYTSTEYPNICILSVLVVTADVWVLYVAAAAWSLGG